MGTSQSKIDNSTSPVTADSVAPVTAPVVNAGSTPTPAATSKESTEKRNVPLWILSPGEDKVLLKEHQAWAEKQCEKQFIGKFGIIV